MTKVRLFIENQEVELSNDVQFAITKQFEDIANPTKIINDWSKTVSVPFTTSNNKLFGNIYRTDRLIVSSNYQHTGLYFDPLRKLDFKLYWGTGLVMVGYAKMNEIKRSKGNGTYELTLFGELGKVFQEMQKITFDEASEESDYIINGSQYVDETANKELVRDSFYSSGQSDDVLRKKTDLGYSVHDIIGFAPNNSFSDGFDYKTFQTSSNSSSLFTDVLGDSFKTATGIEGTTVLPDGILPREIGEYRSYYQLPFIYWSKLFKIFQEKAENVTGYTFDLSEEWFNETNPYWFNLVYMLNPLNNLKNITYNNVYSSSYTSSHIIYHNSSARYKYTWSNYEPGLSWAIDSEQIPVLVNTGSYPHYFHLTDKEVTDGQLSVHFNLSVACNLGSGQDVHIRKNAVILIDVYITDQAIGHSETFNRRLGRICIKDTNSSYVASNTTYTVNVGTKSIPAGSSTWTLVNGDYSFDIPSDLYGKDIKISYGVSGYHAESTFSGTLFVNTNPSSIDLGNITCTARPNSLRLNVTPLIGKSFSRFTLNDLWNKEYNIFNEILKYCKMYRISVSVDEFNKKVIFKPFSKYFTHYSIEDWTEKIDYSKDFKITPITLENKYVLFNYEDSETKLGSMYLNKYGMNYGDFKLITEYNFNNETEELFEEIKPSIVNTDNVLSWTNLHDYHKIIYSFPSEIFVYNKDDDNKQVDLFGAFFFHNGSASFSTESALHLCSVKISDDTVFQQVNNTYFYTQDADTTIACEYYPMLDIIRGDNMCLFNVPSENYTYKNNYSGKSSIYKNFWQKYINERYNIQNKLITCYVKLSPIEYNNFNWNKLVKVDNQLCIVNKIYDYDITSSAPTKVDLVTVQNISGYNTDNYTYDYIIAKPRQLTIPYDYYKEATIISTKPWSIHPNDWQDYLTCEPESGLAGETKIIIGSTDKDAGYTLIFDMYNDEQTEVIGSTTMVCSVGGTSTISLDNWYKQIEPDSQGTVIITSQSAWSLYKTEGSGTNVITLSNTSGPAGSTTITIYTSSPGIGTNYGTKDFYFKNAENDIVMLRVYVPRKLITLSQSNITLSRNSSTTITVYNRSNASWRIESNTGPSNITLSPSTGSAQSDTNVTVTAGSTTGTNTIVLVDNAGNGYRATLTVNVV